MDTLDFVEITAPAPRFDAPDLSKTTLAALDDLCHRWRDLEQAKLALSRDRSATIAYGVRALFVGASGTGKTLAAGWLATRLDLPLYRIDLAAVTGKYIGETEKNLAALFAKAEAADAVLLLDEGDSLFGERTDVGDARDRSTNVDVEYLLQRIESYAGLVILTSNLRTRLDEAVLKRMLDLVEVEFS